MFIQRGETKSRTTPGPTLVMKEWRQELLSKIWVQTGAPITLTLGGTQITESDGNRWPPPKEGPFTDCGSEFFTQKREVIPSKYPYRIYHWKRTTDARPLRMEGTLIANAFKVQNSVNYIGQPTLPLQWNFPPDLSSSRQALEAKGATAIALCSPDNRIAQVATAAGELLQRVPSVPGASLWKSRLQGLRAVAALGDEFLNVVFGVQPTVDEVLDFVKATDRFDEMLEQFIRDSGRVVRRSYHFPKEVSVTETVLNQTYSPMGSAKAVATPYGANWFNLWYGRTHPGYETIRKRTVERETWFSGAFTYHLPHDFDSRDIGDRRRLTARLLGAKPDLNTLWQLTPWSWAVDWVSNASQFVENLQSYLDYGTILRYGYVMEKTTVTDTYSAGATAWLPNPSDGGPNPPHPVVSPVTLRVTTKKRIQANPFGFGFSWEGLSSTQQAILAALGITRTVR